MNTTLYFASCRPTGWGVGPGGSGLLCATAFSPSSWRSGRPLPPADPGLNQLQVEIQRIQEYTANEGLVRIQYKCLVPIYIFPELKLLFPKQNYNGLSPSSALIYM
jgi:hypothetical protein